MRENRGKMEKNTASYRRNISEINEKKRSLNKN
jgi:hypothetical protein